MMDVRDGAQRAPDPLLTEDAAAEHVHGICFKTGPPGVVGVELEWLVCDGDDDASPVDHQRVATALAGLDAPGALPGQGRLTIEPGGQVEISSAPAAAIAGCVRNAGRDLAAVRQAVRAAGISLVGRGVDPHRPPARTLDLPRYAAMEEFFDRSGPWGRVMMCSTASVQVCVDAGQERGGPSGFRWRWHLLHGLGPVLVASFANSPFQDGRVSGWKSTRQAVWSLLDPGSRRWTAPSGLTFRDWVRGAIGPPPTADDLTYHMSTLFPPVRPRGHLELRVIDAQPGDGWIVPTAVAWALLSDPQAGDAALAAT